MVRFEYISDVFNILDSRYYIRLEQLRDKDVER